MKLSAIPQGLSLLASTFLFANADAYVDRVNNGGEILKSLIDRCDIVGIGSSNAGARYALRTIRPSDVESVGSSHVVIRIGSNDKSGARPQRVALFLNEVERGASDEIKSYFISGTFDNNPGQNPGNTMLGILTKIAFNPSDTLKVSLNNSFGFRGTLTKIQQFDEILTSVYSTISGWDLAIPTEYNKQAICAGRETSDQDAIFIR
ncbi:MAG: hypothetical protein RL189_2861 [Pseudomonadota bacterium]|jgi:hypothetical protein